MFTLVVWRVPVHLGFQFFRQFFVVVDTGPAALVAVTNEHHNRPGAMLRLFVKDIPAVFFVFVGSVGCRKLAATRIGKDAHVFRPVAGFNEVGGLGKRVAGGIFLTTVILASGSLRNHFMRAL